METSHNNTTNSQALREFAEELVTKKNYGDITPEVREQLVQDLLVMIDERIKFAIVEAVPEDQLETFNTSMEGKTDAEIQEALPSFVPDLEAVIARALAELGETYLAL